MDIDLINSDDSLTPTTPKNKYTLWRFYDNMDTLLYVSKKPNPHVLMQNEWWFDVATAKIKHFANVGDLEEERVKAIHHENSKWNSHTGT